MSTTRQYIVIEDDDDVHEAGDDFELVDYDTEDWEPEVVAVESQASSNMPRTCQSRETSIRYPEVTLKSLKLGKGIVVKPNKTVELKDHSQHEPNAMHSGDFFRVRYIVLNLVTDQVRFRGHRMRRTKYFGGLFDWKLNELAIILRVNEDDKRSPFIAGMEDIDINDVVRTRECAITDKPYPFLSFRSDGMCAYPVTMIKDDIKHQIFHGGRLACRVVNIQYMRTQSVKSYSGVVRHLYAHEADKPQQASDSSQDPLSYGESITVKLNDDDECVVINKRIFTGKVPVRVAQDEVEMFDNEPPRSSSRTAKDRLTFADAFCGAGGASQGASQAGYNVCWGLDKDEYAIQAYRLNHPSAYALKMDAHNFPPQGISREAWRVDVLHLSPPCCYFSPAHTREGPNDQANYDAIYTIGPILKKIKPRIATLEQTLGLFTSKEHNKTFLMLLYDIGKARYDVRYKIHDFSTLGLVQERKRLLIIAARRGTPLPPFPKPTHGLLGSGLKPAVSIAQALRPLETLQLRDDRYHRPKALNQAKQPYNIYSPLTGCITTSGTTCYHPSGTRRFTTRELSLLQSFPGTYKFTGSNTEASRQIGNAFPPIVAEALFRTIAKTLKAVDNGMIGVEDDLDDLHLDKLLERGANGAPLRQATSSQLSESRPVQSSTPNANTLLASIGGIHKGLQGFNNNSALSSRSTSRLRNMPPRRVAESRNDGEIIDLVTDDEVIELSSDEEAIELLSSDGKHDDEVMDLVVDE